MILFGIKTQEHREIKSYWNTRLNKDYDYILFKNGYNKESPVFHIELKGIKKDLGIKEWRGESEEPVEYASICFHFQ
jgi:hypothetical protein